MKFYILALFIPLLMVIIHSESTLSLEKLIRKILGSSNQDKDQDSKEKEIFTKGSLYFLEFYLNRLNLWVVHKPRRQIFDDFRPPLPPCRQTWTF